MAAVLLLALAGAAVAQNTQLRVTTFNAGLLSALGQGVQYTTEREPAVMSAMATEAANTDVLVRHRVHATNAEQAGLWPTRRFPELLVAAPAAPAARTTSSTVR